jgi:hypothetical protein
MKDTYRVLVDLGILALQTEATQVVTMAIHRIPYLNEPDGFPPPASRPPTLDPRGVWHEAHHLDESVTYLTNTRPDYKNTLDEILMYNQWHTDNVIFPFIKGMSDVTEANGKTMLDNSLVLWGNELARATHHCVNMPVVLFGSAGGSIATNRYLDYSQRNTAQGTSVNMPASFKIWRGIPYNRLLVSILNAFGIPESEYERNTYKGYGAHTSLNASTNKTYEATIADVANVLHRFKA